MAKQLFRQRLPSETIEKIEAIRVHLKVRSAAVAVERVIGAYDLGGALANHAKHGWAPMPFVEPRPPCEEQDVDLVSRRMTAAKLERNQRAGFKKAAKEMDRLLKNVPPITEKLFREVEGISKKRQAERAPIFKPSGKL